MYLIRTPASPAPTFNEAAFKARWRAICSTRGIDPALGATEAQLAERAGDKRAKWWQHPDLWADPGRCRNELEREVFHRLFVQASGYKLSLIEPAPLHQPAYAIGTAAAKVFAFRPEPAPARPWVPLRERLAEQGKTLVHTPLPGGGQRIRERDLTDPVLVLG